MKPIFYILTICTLLCSCAKDLDDLDSPQSTTQRERETQSNSKCEVLYSFETQEYNTYSSAGKPFEEFCQVDLSYMTSAYTQKKQISICYNERHQSCIEIVNQDDSRRTRRSRENPDYGNDIKSMSFCGGSATFTTYSGITETTELHADNSVYTEFVKGIVFTQEQRDSSLQILINEAVISGAKITENDEALILVETDSYGYTIKTFIDKVNLVPLYTETVDKEGNLVSKTIFKYICVDGYIVPDTIINIDVQETKACLDKYITKKVEKFTNHSITLI